MSAPKQFLRLPEVKARVGKSRSAIYRDIQGGTFPAPIRIGARAVAWDSADIEAWQQGKLDAAKLANTAGNVARS